MEFATTNKSTAFLLFFSGDPLTEGEIYGVQLKETSSESKYISCFSAPVDNIIAFFPKEMCTFVGEGFGKSLRGF